MPAPFHAIRDQAYATVDALFAETVRHLPLVGGKQDPGRSASDLSGPLRVGTEKSALVDAAGSGGDLAARIASASAVFYLDPVSNPGAAVQKGDKLHATDRRGTPMFEVLSAGDRQHGRIMVLLGES